MKDSDKVYELGTGDTVASRASSCELCRFLLQRIKWFFRNDPTLANFQTLTCSLNLVRYEAPIPTNRPLVARVLCVTRYRLDLCMKYEMRFYKIAPGDAHYFRFVEIPSVLQPSFWPVASLHPQIEPQFGGKMSPGEGVSVRLYINLAFLKSG